MYDNSDFSMYNVRKMYDIHIHVRDTNLRRVPDPSRGSRTSSTRRQDVEPHGGTTAYRATHRVGAFASDSCARAASVAKAVQAYRFPRVRLSNSGVEAGEGAFARSVYRVCDVYPGSEQGNRREADKGSMPVVEGRGPTAPAPIFVPLNEDEIEVIDRLGRLRAEKYRGRTDTWGKGLLGTNHIDPMVRGVAGEWAFAKWMNKMLRTSLFHVDEKNHRYGDGGKDFFVFDQRIDVKENGKGDTLFIKRCEHGRIIPLKADIYVLTQLVNPSRVLLIGWIKNKGSNLDRFAPARRGEHHNIEIPAAALLPMGRLVQLFNARRMEVQS